MQIEFNFPHSPTICDCRECAVEGTLSGIVLSAVLRTKYPLNVDEFANDLYRRLTRIKTTNTSPSCQEQNKVFQTFMLKNVHTLVSYKIVELQAGKKKPSIYGHP